MKGEPGHELPELLLAGVVTHRPQAAENTGNKKSFISNSPSKVILGQETIALGVMQAEGILEHDVKTLLCLWSVVQQMISRSIEMGRESTTSSMA